MKNLRAAGAGVSLPENFPSSAGVGAGMDARRNRSREAHSTPAATTIVQKLASFAAQSDFSQLPDAVVEECKRIILDSIGCALAAVDAPGGRIGIEYGRLTGGAGGNATIFGTRDRVSIFGAAFANGELINALDFDGVLPPGHVTPYVLPGALAVSESINASGKDFINAMAIAHEMSFRIGKAMDYLRDVKDGKVCPPAVYGYSSAIFGATAAIARLKGLPMHVIADALGIAASISPVNSQVAWFRHAPGSTIKYLLAGGLAQSALTAAHMAELGHRGDVKILDDREFGYPRFIGTSRWDSEPISTGLGTTWKFPAAQTFKPYPHCRIFHALLDALIAIVEDNDLQPKEIEGIKAWVEGFVVQPVWLNRRIEHVCDAQFSLAHGLALGAHRVPPGKEWQDPDLVFSRSVLDLMAKVTHEVHPNYVELLTEHPASQPARIEVSARSKIFVGERRYPKGSKSPDPDSAMTTDELVLKFRKNAEGVLPKANVDGVLHALLGLESVTDINTVTALLRKP